MHIHFPTIAGLFTILTSTYCVSTCTQTCMQSQGFHVVLSDMCHSTMGSSSADVLRSLDLATCAAQLALGSLEPSELHDMPRVHNPMPEPPTSSADNAELQQLEVQPHSLAESAAVRGKAGVLLPKGHLVMKLLQVGYCKLGLTRVQPVTTACQACRQKRHLQHEAAHVCWRSCCSNMGLRCCLHESP